MDGIKRELVYDSLKILDVILTALCLPASIAFANFLPQSSDLTTITSKIADLFSERISIRNAFILFCFIIIWHIIFSYMGFYTSRRLSTIYRELWDITKGVTIVSMILFVAQILYPMDIITLGVLQLFWLFCMFFFITSRLILRLSLFLARKKGRNLRKILIAGSNDRAIKYAEKLTSNRTFGYEIAGFVDSRWHGSTQVTHKWCKIVSDFGSFTEYLRNNIIDEIFIFLPLKSEYATIADIVSASEEQGVTIRMVPDFFNLRIARGRIEKIEDEPMLSLYTGAMNRKLIFLKEIFDRMAAGILLLLFAPVFLCVAVAIKINSAGPVFFLQKRLGYNKRIFHIFKFRTMVPDAEAKLGELEHLNEMGEHAGAFKLKKDPRITPIGKVLRKLSIDELPQLINVLKGDMSLVGPRPLTERDYREFKLYRQIRRFSVKPGITCIWQISGRNNISFDQWMEYDMQYIDEWNLLLDVKILLKTIPAVVSGHGAA